jgi:CheY-like chemotaxis protein
MHFAEEKLKILIVDDDDAVLLCIGSRLRSGGFEVKEASTGDGAMYVYEHQGPFAFVLSDYRFVPGAKIKDGVQLVTAIHEINSHQRMAMMTADPKEAREKLPKAPRKSCSSQSAETVLSAYSVSILSS